MFTAFKQSSGSGDQIRTDDLHGMDVARYRFSTPQYIADFPQADATKASVHGTALVSSLKGIHLVALSPFPSSVSYMPFGVSLSFGTLPAVMGLYGRKEVYPHERQAVLHRNLCVMSSAKAGTKTAVRRKNTKNRLIPGA